VLLHIYFGRCPLRVPSVSAETFSDEANVLATGLSRKRFAALWRRLVTRCGLTRKDPIRLLRALSARGDAACCFCTQPRDGDALVWMAVRTAVLARSARACLTLLGRERAKLLHALLELGSTDAFCVAATIVSTTLDASAHDPSGTLLAHHTALLEALLGAILGAIDELSSAGGDHDRGDAMFRFSVRLHLVASFALGYSRASGGAAARSAGAGTLACDAVGGLMRCALVARGSATRRVTRHCLRAVAACCGTADARIYACFSALRIDVGDSRASPREADRRRAPRRALSARRIVGRSLAANPPRTSAELPPRVTEALQSAFGMDGGREAAWA
jgi:hypothetical protein